MTWHAHIKRPTTIEMPRTVGPYNRRSVKSPCSRARNYKKYTVCVRVLVTGEGLSGNSHQASHRTIAGIRPSLVRSSFHFFTTPTVIATDQCTYRTLHVTTPPSTQHNYRSCTQHKTRGNLMLASLYSAITADNKQKSYE